MVDGNKYFLDKYLDEQENYTDIEEDFTPVTGEVLLDEITDVGFTRGYKELVRCGHKYPESDFPEAIKKAEQYIKKKEEYPTLVYIKHLANTFYRQVENWFDVKWLVFYKHEEFKAVESVFGVLADNVYGITEEWSAEEFVDLIMVGSELLEVSEEHYCPEVNNILLEARRDVVLRVIGGKGLTKDYYMYYSPDQIAQYITENKKTVGRGEGQRLQVSDTERDNIFKELGISSNGTTLTLRDKVSIYVMISRFYNKPTKSKKFQSTVERTLLELTSNYPNKYNNVELIPYSVFGVYAIVSETRYIIIDTNFKVYQRYEQGRQGLVYSKSIHKLRVGDIVSYVKIL